MRSEARPEKVLFICNAAWFFVSHRLVLAQSAVAAGYEVTVCASADEQAAKITAVGAEFRDWRVGRSSMGPVSELTACWQLWRTVREIRPDIIHLVTPKGILYGGLVARLYRRAAAVVVAVSGQGFASSDRSRTAGLIRRLVRFAYRAVFRRPRVRFIVQNSSDRAHFAELLDRDVEGITMIPGSGVDLQVYRPGEESAPPVVLFAARMIWSKGVGEFVEIARAALAAGTRATFVLAGDADPDNPRSVPEAQLVEWNASGTVTWLGRVDDLDRVMRTSALICYPTTYGEGTPKFLLEAAACAKPIVATDWPGCDEAVRDGVTGFLCPPGDVAAFTQRVIELIEDPALRARFGSAGREMAVARFSEDLVARTTLGIYESMLADHRADA